MGRYEPGLLTCLFCDTDLEFFGKTGSFLQTRCPGCGMSSETIADDYLSQDRGPQVEVYYNRGKAPPSVPPPG